MTEEAGDRSPLTEEELAAIRARAEAATPGPWTPFCACSGVDDWDATATAGLGFDVEGPPEPDLARYRFDRGRDALFVGHAREDVPRLLDELERLRAELAAAEEYGEECLRRMGGTW